MTERELSQLQQEYRTFFLEKLKLYSVNSPAELAKEKKSEFFTSIKQDWAKIKLEKKQTKIARPTETKLDRENPRELFNNSQSKDAGGKPKKTEFAPISQEFAHEIIKSVPNIEQTDDLKIQYTPNNYFQQAANYQYPVVKMPCDYSYLKLPRLGRSNQKGYKEKDFFNQLKLHFTDLELMDNVHMVIPNFNKPYEPDILLFDKKFNLYIDIEIDEPYDGYYRYPTHCIISEDEQKQDNIRDLFFTESGWIVIRFTEKQVHLQGDECVDHIRNVINSVSNQNFNSAVNCEIEKQWDENKCIQWQKNNYREKYLGIDKFYKRNNTREVKIDIEHETIEDEIQRSKKPIIKIFNPTIDEERADIISPIDETGNAKYISVTTLIERFFPFDLKKFIEEKAKKENRAEEDVLIEFLMIRDEAAEKGTYLHTQIENYLKCKGFVADFKEFDLFLKFFDSEIKTRNLEFYDAEKKIVSHRYNVAGTIDCLFKKKDRDEYVMMDWKRSKKLIIDGHPRIFGFGFALSELNHLDNSSYYKYCLQQNIYKYIVESEYAIKISSMKLLVLHENYLEYYIVNVPEMSKETRIILNSLQHKI